MLAIGDKLVSEDLLRIHFVCDLEACKGACCVEGDLGAPLDEDELSILDAIYPEVMPYLPAKGRQAIAEQGKYITHENGSWSTPLVQGRECAYVVWQGEKTMCGIELAHREGKVAFPKPISCHLYPVRLKNMVMMEMEAINYETWDICKPACKLGKQLKVPLYKFLKAPLTRKFGEAFYNQMSEVLEAFDAARRP